MTLVAKSDQSTGNSTFASYVLQSNELVFTFTAPYAKYAYSGPEQQVQGCYTGSTVRCSRRGDVRVVCVRSPCRGVAVNSTPGSVPIPHFNHDTVNDFIIKHGFAARAIGQYGH